jgi:cell division protease FtsH
MNVFIILIYLGSVTCFFKPTSKITNFNIHNNLRMDNYYQDVDLIHKYKFFFQQNNNYNEIIKDIVEKHISKIYINTDYRELVSIDNIDTSNMPYNNFHLTNINPIMIPKIIDKATESNVPIYFADFSYGFITNLLNLLYNFVSIVGYSIPLFIIFSLIMSFRRANINNLQNSGNSFPGNSLFNMFSDNDDEKYIAPNVSLSSWAGSPEVIEECKEVISYLDKKKIYEEIGAEMPRGILLEGPPGTGKTLLAKAIATETNSTFISMSGSEFIELFVGMGSLRVRELFDKAREKKPSIIFIDEIDAIGKQRGASLNTGNDEREQTLNQLLYEMDGFNDNTDIVILAATNRKDILDSALLRPGRFDRIIKVPLPDRSSRVKILEVYLKGKKLENPFDVSSIAELTDGFSGAELKNLVNEAAIISAKNNYTKIQEKYIFDAFEKSIVGLIKTNSSVAPITNLRVAVHESGHSLLVLKFKEYFDLQKVSIQPTYNGAGGYTIFTEHPEIKEGGLYTKDMLKKRLIITMGGKAAESIYYGNEFVSLGAVQDLNQANKLAKRMIGNFGMGKELEVFYNENIGETDIYFNNPNKYSEYTKSIIDKETLDLVKEAYNEAKLILNDNIDKLIYFIDLLQNNTVVYKKEIDSFTL